MGIRLIVEVLDHAPPTLSAAERLLLVVVAENANDTTREGWPGMDVLCRRVGLKPAGVRKALQRLAGRGLDVRVALGKDGRGEPVYSWPGKRTTYRLPRLKGDPTGSPKGDPAGSPSEEKWRSSGDGMVIPQARNGDPTGSPIPSVPSKNPQRASEPTDDEQTEVLAEIRRRKPDASGALIRHIYRQDGAAILAELRDQATRDRIAGWLAWADTQPPCDPVHAIPGGNLIRPDTGEPRCAGCRARHRRTAQEAS